jgi:hypothetical protein
VVQEVWQFERVESGASALAFQIDGVGRVAALMIGVEAWGISGDSRAYPLCDAEPALGRWAGTERGPRLPG